MYVIKNRKGSFIKKMSNFFWKIFSEKINYNKNIENRKTKFITGEIYKREKIIILSAHIIGEKKI